MNNEQIKEELLKAKEAFIKSKKSEENDLRKENLEIIEGIKTKDENGPHDIMRRVKLLFEEAEGIDKSSNENFINIENNSNNKKNLLDNINKKPFWSQNYELSPSDQFKKKKKMQDQDLEDLKKEEKVEVETEENTSETGVSDESSSNDANSSNIADASSLDDIKAEVMGKINEAKPDTELIKKSLSSAHDRIDLLEPQIEKHKKDITALLKLVRELSKKQSEIKIPLPQDIPRKNNFSVFFLSVIFLGIGIVGWLYWMDPTKLNLIFDQIYSNLINNFFKLINFF